MDKSELGGDLVTDETEPNLPRKLEPILGLTLHLRERISRREKVRDQVVAAVCRKGKVTDPVGGIEGATYQIAASLDMSRPWQDDISERHIGSSLKTLQAAFFDQVISKPAESSSSLVVAEARSGDDRKPYVGKARPVAIAVLKTKVDHPADDNRKQILIGKQGRWHEFAQDVQSVEEVRVGYQRQVNELLDLPVSKLGPDSIVLAPRFIAGRMR